MVWRTRRLGYTKPAIPVNRHQPQAWRQADVGEHFQGSAFVVQQSFRDAK